MKLREMIREEIDVIVREMIQETIEEIALAPESTEGKYYPENHTTLKQDYQNWKSKHKKKVQNKAERADLDEDDDAFEDAEGEGEELEECEDN